MERSVALILVSIIVLVILMDYFSAPSTPNESVEQFQSTSASSTIKSNQSTDVDSLRRFDGESTPANNGIPPETVMELIKKDFIIPDYNFNPGLLPITTIFPNRFDDDFMVDYEENIKKVVHGWNKIFPKYFNINRPIIKYIDLRPIFLKETATDFILKTIIRVQINNDFYNLEADFYGNKKKSDDLFDYYVVFTFYLINIRFSPNTVNYQPNPILITNDSFADFTLARDDPKKFLKYIEELHQSEMVKKKDIANNQI